MVGKGVEAVEGEPAGDEDDSERMEAGVAERGWAQGGMRNWYRKARGRVFAVMPWRLVDYWQMTREPRLEEFETRPAS